MIVTIELPDVIVVPLGKKAKFGELSTAASALSADIIARLALHGLKQKLNDPLGAKTLADAAKPGVAGKVLDALVRGEWSARGTAAPKAPMTEAACIAEAALELMEARMAADMAARTGTKPKVAEVREAIVARFGSVNEAAARVLAHPTLGPKAEALGRARWETLSAKDEFADLLGDDEGEADDE